jgi:hypothetical protein
MATGMKLCELSVEELNSRSSMVISKWDPHHPASFLAGLDDGFIRYDLGLRLHLPSFLAAAVQQLCSFIFTCYRLLLTSLPASALHNGNSNENN